MKYRFLAHVTVEAATPVKVSSGEKDVETDSIIARDVNGLPYLPGTSLAGVFRRLFDEETAGDIFGFQTRQDGMGSRIVITDGCLCGRDSLPVEGLDADPDAFLSEYGVLPVRQHVRINARGAAAQAGKFDEQVVFKGSRFCFEIGLSSDREDEKSVIDTILGGIRDGAVRVGGGTMKGFGALTVRKASVATLDLSEEEQCGLYIDKPSSLRESAAWKGWKDWTSAGDSDSDWTVYELRLEPRSFFLFSSGFTSEDGNANMAPVEEKVIEWKADGPVFVRKHLMPATSLKGALAHRTAYHYNRMKGIFADDIDSPENFSGVRNDAVRILFGYVDERDKTARKGRVSIDDFYYAPTSSPKLLNHLSVDPFSGGASPGALFTEQVDDAGGEIVLRIRVFSEALSDATVKSAFEAALEDVRRGRLPLGGGVNRGNGVFISR